MDKSEKKVKISIILPNFNSEKYLSRCIQSFLDQEYDNKEMIIVDGKSSDSSHLIIEEFCSRNSSIIWIKEKDTCVTDGFNIGLKYVTGDFIGFMASDAAYFTNDIFRTIDEGFKVVKFDSIHFNAYSYFKTLKEEKITLRNCNFPFTRDSLLQNMCFIPFENIFFQKKIYHEYQLDPNYNLSSDIEFYLRILGRNILSFFVNKPSTINIYDGTNLSMLFSSKQSDEWIEVDIKFLFHNPPLTLNKLAFHKLMVRNEIILEKNSIDTAEAWLTELIDANRRCGFYSEQIFANKFLPYWENLLYRSTRLGIFSYLRFFKSPLTKKLGMTKKTKIILFIKSIVLR